MNNGHNNLYDPDLNYYNEVLDSISSQQESHYVSVEEINSCLNVNSKSFNFLTYNIRSYSANSDYFFSMFNSLNLLPDCLNFNETWFDENSQVEIDGYRSYHVVRSTGRSGGVSVFVRDKYFSKFISRFSLSNETIESCCIEVLVDGQVFAILAIYRPHSDSIDNFTRSLDDILSDSFFQNKVCVVMGDFNINLLNDTSPILNFICNMQSHNFLPLVTKPTRLPTVEGQSPSLIDNIFINSLRNKFSCSIILHDFTDHYPIILKLFLKNSTDKNNDKIKIHFRLKNEANFIRYRQSLEAFDWRSLRSQNVNTYLENFLSALNNLYCSCFPLTVKSISEKIYDNPWINSDVRNLISAKSNYYQLFKMNLVSREDKKKILKYS